ncbi:hypothetical protein SAMN05444358_107166 [Ruegeria halocynthiae]|uniref:DUF1440 domain-containing protein n=1 Tax=Ruegeria halocynthiae TaxID=985054 RepID=A0A1H3CX00_9RHOB|nr:hypothetical protein [Ruegeria halocynthiae]SDX58733.1 hypothetical protein SAMN05444358_107166 [Ruegeria halocynthiae]
MENSRLSATYIGFLFIAGFFATIAFDTWGQIISPSLGWANLSPEGLASSLLGRLGLPTDAFLGFFIHFYIVGLIAYPMGWAYVFKPIWARVLGRGHWVVASAIYGFGLWVFAIGGVTTFSGLPPFLNFTGITWVALIGHVLYGIVLVAILRLIARRDA